MRNDYSAAMDSEPSFSSNPWNCPIELSVDAERIGLSIGEGARHSRRFLQKTVFPRLGCPATISDAAAVLASHQALAICTDSHTVTPLFFPGGDLGALAVLGTVNDLAVSGATPRWMTLSLILEEGFPVAVLEQLLDSAAKAASQCGVRIVTGDTKVVPKGAVDGVFMNTTGVGEFRRRAPAGPATLKPGDRILVSGPIGQHGLAVLASRQGMSFLSAIESDLKCVLQGTEALLDAAGEHVRCMRDATRGGVSSVLHEWAEESSVSFELYETDIPVSRAVRGACEVLGFEPLYLANEGTFVAAIAEDAAGGCLAALQSVPEFQDAAIIGHVTSRAFTPVSIRRSFGPPVPLDEPGGAPFPRIC